MTSVLTSSVSESTITNSMYWQNRLSVKRKHYETNKVKKQPYSIMIRQHDGHNSHGSLDVCPEESFINREPHRHSPTKEQGVKTNGRFRMGMSWESFQRSSFLSALWTFNKMGVRAYWHLLRVVTFTQQYGQQFRSMCKKSPVASGLVTRSRQMNKNDWDLGGVSIY